MTSQSPGSLSVPASPEEGFNLPSPTLTPDPSSPTSVQDALIPELSLSDVDISTSTHPLSVSGDGVVSSAMSGAHPNQLWAQDGVGMQRKSGLLLVPPTVQPPQPAFSTSCFRLLPPQRPAPVFSWAPHYQHPSAMMPQFYRPREYRQQVNMTEPGRPFVPHTNYVGVQGVGVEGFPSGVLPQVRGSTLQYRGTPHVPMFSPTIPMQQHGCYNMLPPMHETQLPNFLPTGAHFSHFHDPPNFRSQASSQVPSPLFPQAVLRTPTTQLYPQPPMSQLRPLHPQTPMSQFRPHVSQLHPQTPMSQLRRQTPMSQFPQTPMSQLRPQTRPQTPMSQLRPQTSPMSQLRRQTPTSQLRPQIPMSQLRPPVSISQFRPQTTSTQLHSQVQSQLHPQGSPQLHPQGSPLLHPQGSPQLHPQGSPLLHPQGSPQFHPQDSPLHPQGSPQLYPARSQVTPQPQTATSLRPQTAPPQIATSQPQHSSPSLVPQCCQPSQENFIDLTKDVYSAQQRIITRVCNYASVPSSQIPLPRLSPLSQGSSVSMNQQFCSTPPACGSSCGHTIVRPKPIHSTTHGNPGFSPAAVRATVPSVPLSSPFTPTSSAPKPASLSSAPSMTRPESIVPTSACTVAATGSPPPDESVVSATTTTRGNQRKQTGRTKKPVKRNAKPRPKTGGRKSRRTKQPAEGVSAVAVTDGDVGSCQEVETGEQVEISEQVVEVIASDLAEMQIYVDFVKHFKSHHLKLGYKLEDIIQQVAIRYGKKISLQYIQDFEDLLLQKESYFPLLEILDTWVKDTAKASGSSDKDIVMLPANSICPHRTWKQKRKQKTSVNTDVTLRLEEEFFRKKSPTPAELGKLASSLGVEKDYVRNWFYNRRRKEKCLGKRPAGKEESVGIKDIPEILPELLGMEEVDVKIPSIDYDITVEVPSIYPCDMMSPVTEYTVQN